MKLLIAKDKLLHFIICAVIAILTGLISHYLLNHSATSSLFVGLFAALFIGVCKELYDVFVKSREWDKYDLLADFIGGVVGIGIYLVIVGNHII